MANKTAIICLYDNYVLHLCVQILEATHITLAFPQQLIMCQVIRAKLCLLIRLGITVSKSNKLSTRRIIKRTRASNCGDTSESAAAYLALP